MPNRVLNRIIVAAIVAALLLLTFVGCVGMRFDQITSKNELLTETYSASRIEELKNAAEGETITYAKFKRDFVVECIRETHQGYYVVLLLEDGNNAFCFFNEKDILTRVIVSNGFKSKIEFQNIIIEQMPKSEMLNFDKNTIVTPISAIEITAHIVKEGILIVKYSRFKDGKIIEDPIATSIEFIENGHIATSEDLFIKNEIPFIFDIDKSPIPD